MKLSIVIPVYNEKKTIEEILRRVMAVRLPKVEKEIIIIDDKSTDGTKEILKKIKEKHPRFKIVFRFWNGGKGATVRTGLKYATGDYIIIQDADLEYNPQDIPRLLKPVLEGKAKVVYGSRNLNPKNKKHSSLSFYIGGIFLTWLTNLLYGTKITDESTGYKVFETEFLKSIPLECRGFEFCPEITAKVAKRGEKIHEVPIRYCPRMPHQGKHVKQKDGLIAIWTLIKFRFLN